MRGKHAHDCWRHMGRRGVDQRRRCAEPAAYVTAAGQRLCAKCLEHTAEVLNATLRLSRAQLKMLRTAKRIRRAR